MSECCICTTELSEKRSWFFRTSNIWSCKKCKNKIHLECWNKWNKTGKNTCPFCRVPDNKYKHFEQQREELPYDIETLLAILEIIENEL